MATAKDISFYSQEKATTNILHFHCKDKTCKGKRHFSPRGFKPGQWHTLLCYCADLDHYLYIGSNLEQLSVEQSSEKALAPGHGGCSSLSWEVPAPSFASPILCLFRPPIVHGRSDERQSWSSDQSVQPSHSRELSPRLARWPSCCSTAGRARAATREAAGPNSQELQREKGKEQSKPPVSRDRMLLQPKGFIEQQPEELQRNLKLNKQSMYC